MNLKELIESRYSVRNYLQKEIEKEKIECVLNCARLAPSACNFQPWHFYVVSDAEIKGHIVESYNREWFKSAPVYLVVCENREEAWVRKYDNKNHADIDASIACEHICLAIAEVGLGTCWVCNFDPTILKKALSITDTKEPIAIFPIGYIDEENSKVPEKKRKSISETTNWL